MKKSKKTVEGSKIFYENFDWIASLEQFEEAKQSWTAFKRELTSQIEDLKENNNFSGILKNRF